MDKSNFNDIRRNNISLVLSVILQQAPVSRAEIAKITGLTRATVSSLVSDLIELGTVREIGESTAVSVGKKATLLQARTNRIYTVSVEFYSSNIYVAKVNLCGQIEYKLKRHVDPAATADEVLQALFSSIDEVRDSIYYGNGLCYGIGVAVPAPVHNGVMQYSLHFQELCNIDLYQKLSQRYDCRIIIYNNADAAAMAEGRYGHHSGYHCLLYIWIEQGIGCGIVKDGKLVQNPSGLTNEFGHIHVNPDGNIPCFCGKQGCLTSYGSDLALAYRLQSCPETAALVHPDGQGLNLDFEALRQLLSAEPAGICAGFVRETARYLGLGLSALVDIAVPDVIVVQGSIFSLPAFLNMVRTYCAEFSHPFYKDLYTITDTTVGKNAVLTGTASFLLQELYSDPYLISELHAEIP